MRRPFPPLQPGEQLSYLFHYRDNTPTAPLVPLSSLLNWRCWSALSVLKQCKLRLPDLHFLATFLVALPVGALKQRKTSRDEAALSLAEREGGGNTSKCKTPCKWYGKTVACVRGCHATPFGTPFVKHYYQRVISGPASHKLNDDLHIHHVFQILRTYIKRSVLFEALLH